MPQYIKLLVLLTCLDQRRAVPRRPPTPPQALTPQLPLPPRHPLLRRPRCTTAGRWRVSGDDTMKFSVTEIPAKPGERLSVTLVNLGTTPKFSMGHNWVLARADG